MERLQRMAFTTSLTFMVIVLTMTACGTRLAAPVQLSPAGDIAFYAVKIISGVSVLQQVAIDGEASKVIPTDDARKIVEATRTAGIGGIALSNALKAGAGATTERDKAIATIRSAMTDLVMVLSPETAALVGPYITVVTTLLTVFQS